MKKMIQRYSLCVLFPTLLLLYSCAHTTTKNFSKSPLMTIDVRGADNLVDFLHEAKGKVVVLDVCVAWNDVCLINANMLSQICREMCGDEVIMYSMLLDEPPLDQKAIESYKNILKVHQNIVRPGPLTLAGKSALGKLAIPRIIIFGKDGQFIDNFGGAVISGSGLMNHLHHILKK